MIKMNSRAFLESARHRSKKPAMPGGLSRKERQRWHSTFSMRKSAETSVIPVNQIEAFRADQIWDAMIARIDLTMTQTDLAQTEAQLRNMPNIPMFPAVIKATIRNILGKKKPD